MITDRGFNLVGQMMIGLPESTIDDEIRTAREISEMCGAARIYPTVVFRDTDLCGMAESGKYLPLTLEDAVRRENKNSAKEQKEAAETEEVKVNYLRAIEERFTGITGRRCKIADKKRGVKTITLEYRDDGDLEELLKKLAGDDVFKDF